MTGADILAIVAIVLAAISGGLALAAVAMLGAAARRDALRPSDRASVHQILRGSASSLEDER